MLKDTDTLITGDYGTVGAASQRISRLSTQAGWS
jgi:hypothetical protein